MAMTAGMSNNDKIPKEKLSVVKAFEQP